MRNAAALAGPAPVRAVHVTTALSVAAAAVAILILLGATIFKSSLQSAENATPQSSTEAPATGQN